MFLIIIVVFFVSCWVIFGLVLMVLSYLMKIMLGF